MPLQVRLLHRLAQPLRALPLERVAADLRYLARALPGTICMFHDPNFAVNFEQVFGVLEAAPPGERPPYMMESSLSVLRPERIARLRETNCVLVAPGVESWTDYSNKAGVGRATACEKVELVAEHFRRLADNVPYVQANLMFGLDSRRRDAPVELSQRFMDRTPFAWPALNIPVPFGGTPLYDEMLGAGRILEAMPFGFYYAPYLVTTLKHYDTAAYYERLIALFAHLAAPVDAAPAPAQHDAPADQGRAPVADRRRASLIGRCQRDPPPAAHGRGLPRLPRGALAARCPRSTTRCTSGC